MLSMGETFSVTTSRVGVVSVVAVLVGEIGSVVEVEIGGGVLVEAKV
jgi:hypothetical protein